MPPRHGSRQIATPPVERTQYTTSSEPEDSTPDPRQASGNCHESEQSPDVTCEPSGGRTLSEIDEELGTVFKLLLKLCRQGYDDQSLRQQSECITRLQELRLEFESIFFNPPPQANLASTLPPIENPEILISTSILTTEALKRKYPPPHPAIHHLPLSKGRILRILGIKISRGQGFSCGESRFNAHCRQCYGDNRPSSRSACRPILWCRTAVDCTSTHNKTHLFHNANSIHTTRSQ
jgi:hypothetical protein